MDDTEQQLDQSLMEFNENQEPIIAWAEGQRAALIARGWAEESADRYACELLIGWTRVIFGGVARKAS